MIQKKEPKYKVGDKLWSTMYGSKGWYAFPCTVTDQEYTASPAIAGMFWLYYITSEIEPDVKHTVASELFKTEEEALASLLERIDYWIASSTKDYKKAKYRYESEKKRLKEYAVIRKELIQRIKEKP